MSTNPGDETWRDAGLVDQEDEPVSLVEEAVADDGEPVPTGADPAAGEYRPRHSARPDLVGEADEADVAEQASAVPGAEEDYA